MIPVFIEIFSGSARLARAVNAAGWLAMKWDILDGADYDLLRPVVQRLLKGWLRAGQIRAFHMGFSCASWSRARDCPNGPPRLRSPQHVLGLPNLHPWDQVKVEAGNELVRFTVQFCRYAIKLQVPWTIENPSTSYAWDSPAMQRLTSQRRVISAKVEFCSFGTPWRKSTAFRGYAVNLRWMDHHRCTGHLCRYTGRKHMVLSGKVPGETRFRTSVAEPYPQKLCSKLAATFVDEAARTRAAYLSARVTAACVS